MKKKVFVEDHFIMRNFSCKMSEYLSGVMKAVCCTVCIRESVIIREKLQSEVFVLFIFVFVSLAVLRELHMYSM